MLSCAKQQQTVEEEKEELDLLREKITAARQQGEDLEPERKALGFSLKTVYNERLQANKKQQDFQKDCAQTAEREAAEEAQKAEGLEEKIRDCFGIKGKLESQIEAYSRQEEQSNRETGSKHPWKLRSRNTGNPTADLQPGTG